MLPLSVIDDAAANLANYEGCGQSVMEMSHRSKEFGKIIEDAEANLRELMNIPRWPGHLPLSKNMEMQMFDRLKRIFTVVAHNPIAVFQSQLCGDIVNFKQDIAQKRLIFLFYIIEGLNVLFRDDQDVNPDYRF